MNAAIQMLAVRGLPGEDSNPSRPPFFQLLTLRAVPLYGGDFAGRAAPQILIFALVKQNSGRMV
jgi:hypothetical protein